MFTAYFFSKKIFPAIIILIIPVILYAFDSKNTLWDQIGIIPVHPETGQCSFPYCAAVDPRFNHLYVSLGAGSVRIHCQPGKRKEDERDTLCQR